MSITKSILNCIQIQSLDITSITPSAPCDRPTEWIESMAQLIIECGNVRPIYVEAITYDAYTCINGNDILHAAIRAHEIDDDVEMISAVIVTSANREAVERQLALMA